MLVELINQPSKGIEECPEGPGSSGYDFSTDWPHQGTCIGKNANQSTPGSTSVFLRFTEEKSDFIFLFTYCASSTYAPRPCMFPERLPPLLAGSSQAQPPHHSRGLLQALGISAGLKAHVSGPLGARDALHRCQGSLDVCLPHFCLPLPTQSLSISLFVCLQV